MARNKGVLQTTGLASNPYPKPKDRDPIKTYCELCDRTMNTRDWAAHKNSKKHIAAEEAEKSKARYNAAAALKLEIPSHVTNMLSVNASDVWAPEGNEFAAPADDGWVTTSANDGFGGGAAAPDYGFSGGAVQGDGCFKCGGSDHIKRDCPMQVGNGCYNCGEVGHRKNECPNSRKPMGGSGSDRACYNCGGTGHLRSDCDQSPSLNVGGGGRTCHNCKLPGHVSRDCPEPKVMRCNNCDAVGHMFRECDQPKDWSRVKCTNCHNYGHGVKRCPEPPAEVDDGGWNTNDTPSGAASGAWADDTPAANTGSWADESAAADSAWPETSSGW